MDASHSSELVKDAFYLGGRHIKPHILFLVGDIAMDTTLVATTAQFKLETGNQRPALNFFKKEILGVFTHFLIRCLIVIVNQCLWIVNVIGEIIILGIKFLGRFTDDDKLVMRKTLCKFYEIRFECIKINVLKDGQQMIDYFINITWLTSNLTQQNCTIFVITTVMTSQLIGNVPVSLCCTDK